MSEKVRVEVKKLHPDAVIPKYQNPGDAGFDIHACISIEEAIASCVMRAAVDLDFNHKLKVLDTSVAGYCVKKENRSIWVGPQTQLIVSTGLAFSVPPGFELQIRPRSGLASKQKLTITNAPGTLDSGYSGEMKIILFNLGNKDIEIKHGDRIAQGVVGIVPSVNLVEVSKLSNEDSERGTGGFGSTGR